MPGASTAEMAATLRTKAHQHVTVATLKAQLPTLPEDGTPAQGLYVDTNRTPGITVNGELRVSILRVFSVGPDGRALVGQVQAVRPIDHPLETWRLRFYTHEPEHFSTSDHETEDSWWVRLLELHYEQSDVRAELDLELVPA